MEFVADLVILMVLLVAVYVGIARGLWGPLLTEGAFLIGFLVDIRLVMPILGNVLASGALRTGVGVVVFVVVGIAIRFLAKPLYVILQRLPITRQIDSPAGAVVHGLVGFILLYLTLGLVLDFDRNVYPMLAAGVATAQQINDYQQAINDRPYLHGVVDEQQLKQAQAQAQVKPIPDDVLLKAEKFLDFYVTNVRNPLIDSRLAPIINRVGEKLPVFGQARPYMTGAKHA
ncbi:MAG: CvpA family protein [Candidatus Dormiibacterota bacterium]